MLHRRDFLIGAGAALAVGAGIARPAGAADDPALVAAAKKEDKGTLYTAIDPGITQAVVDAFARHYGVGGFDITRVLSASLQARIATEMENKTTVFDVVINTDRAFIAMGATKGWWADFTNVPGIEALPAAERTDFSMVLGHVPYSLVWNADEFKDGMTGWQDLLKPQFAGRVMLIDPRLGGNPGLWYVLMRKTYGDDFLRALGRGAHYSPSAVPGLQQVAAGAMGIYAPGIHQAVLPLLAKGAPIGEAFPGPTISSDNLLNLSARAPHPNLTRLFAGYCLTMEAQQILNKDGFSPLPGVPGTRKLPQLVTLDPAESGAQQADIVKLMGAA